MQEHKTLAAALVAAQAAAESVGKEATNKFHNYKYASAEAIMVESRLALNSAGLATLMERWELLPPTHDGAPERVKVHFLTLHAHSDQTLKGETEYFVMPEKGRPEDKATATALTYAEGYYLRGLLCLPRVEEGSQVDDRDDREKLPGPRRPPSKTNGNGHKTEPSDPAAVAREEYKAKLSGLSPKKLVEKLIAFDQHADKAIAQFGNQDEVDLLRAATITRLYQMLDLDVGGLPTEAKAKEWENWRTTYADKYLTQMQVDTLSAKLARRIEAIEEDLAAAQRQTR